MKKYATQGFTLIELSIVLVIIGLIVGGVLTGQSLIAAAGVRAQITQIEKYNTAANTFYGKYGYLPGDIPAGPAALFGFASRGTQGGEGDGNGVIEGIQYNNPSQNDGMAGAAGETAMFWVDLSTAHLIDGGFNTATSSVLPSSDVNGALLNSYLPQAKIGNGNYVYVLSMYQVTGGTTGQNYFGISAVTNIAAVSNQDRVISKPGLTVAQAYALDTKVDDGLPISGRVTAEYTNFDILWTDGTDAVYSPPPTFNIAPSSTSCYDNANVFGGIMKYTLSQNSGAGANCALSFRMQAGD